MKKSIFIFILLIQFGSSQEYYYKNNTKILLKNVHTEINDDTSKVSYYKNEKGILLGVTDKVIVKTVDVNLLEKYVHALNASIEKKLAKDLYLVKVTNKNKTLDIANELNKKESIEYAHPDFIKKRVLR